MVLLALRNPIPQSYANTDEIAYASLAISLLEHGTYRVDAQPVGILSTDGQFAANPQLYPYLAYLSFRSFGISRITMRLPAALAFLAAAVVLAALAVRSGLPPVSVVCVLLLMLSCPFLLYAARTARPETLSTAAIYLSCWLCFLSRHQQGRRQVLTLAAGGGAAALAVWNHPLFAGCALLPPFFLRVQEAADSTGAYVRKIAWWMVGGAAAVAAFAAVLVLPHADAWREQFLVNAASISEAERNPGSDRLAFSPIKVLTDLRARFSTFGQPYLLWYLAAPLVFFGVLRPTRRFALAAVLSLVWLLISTHFTFTAVTYIIQFTAAIPLLALLCASREGGPAASGPGLAAVSVTAALLVGAHAAMVFMPTFESRAFEDREAELNRTVASLPGTGPITGPVEAALPTWKAHRRYFLPDPPFFDTQPGVRERFAERVRAEAEWFIHPDGSAQRTPP